MCVLYLSQEEIDSAIEENRDVTLEVNPMALYVLISLRAIVEIVVMGDAELTSDVNSAVDTLLADLS